MSNSIECPVAGFTIRETRNRAGKQMFLAFVCKQQKVYPARKGAVARTFTVEQLCERLRDPVLIQSVSAGEKSKPVKAVKEKKQNADRQAKKASGRRTKQTDSGYKSESTIDRFNSNDTFCFDDDFTIDDALLELERLD